MRPPVFSRFDIEKMGGADRLAFHRCED